MAYFKITQNKKGQLQAKIQVSGKDLSTGKSKVFTKRVYNTDKLTEAKFRRQVDKIAIAFEEEVLQAYEEGEISFRSKVLTFSELMKEWKTNIKANLSLNYYERAEDVEFLFNRYLSKYHLNDNPISDITVRDVQLFFDELAHEGYKRADSSKLKKDLPQIVNFRLLAREGIIDRYRSYNLKRGVGIQKDTAEKICDYYQLNYSEFFETFETYRPYAIETLKGHRRILRTVFNEAMRYEWISKNPVCATKISADRSNVTLRSIIEKEVFSFAEAKDFLKKLDDLTLENLPKKIVLKFILLTGVRSAEMCGLKWSDIDFDKKIVHVRRNRIYSHRFGVYEKEPKTKTSLRDIPLPDALIADLKLYKDWFRLADPKIDEHLDKYYLAVNVCREPIHPHGIGHFLTKFEDKYGFRHVTCHGLRHTYCSLLLSQNVPIQTVSKYLGHSDSTVTLKIYSHFIPDTQERALNALNNLIP